MFNGNLLLGVAALQSVLHSVKLVDGQVGVEGVELLECLEVSCRVCSHASINGGAGSGRAIFSLGALVVAITPYLRHCHILRGFAPLTETEDHVED